MSDYSDVCYKNSFLSTVIVRIDFLQFVKNEIAFQSDIEKEILKIFPKRGKDQIIRFNSMSVYFDQSNNGLPNANGESQEGIQREYYSHNGANKLILTNKFIIFEIKDYSNFEEHKSWFERILFTFFQKCRVSAQRSGIRYINIFNQEKVKLQKNYFSDEIAATLIKNDKLSNTRLIRSMHLNEYNIDDMTMNFRYGMFNPEYPNILKKTDFVLDFDFFTDSIIETSDGVLQVIKKGHQEIQQKFESSITDNLRGVMMYE